MGRVSSVMDDRSHVRQSVEASKRAVQTPSRKSNGAPSNDRIRDRVAPSASKAASASGRRTDPRPWTNSRSAAHVADVSPKSATRHRVGSALPTAIVIVSVSITANVRSSHVVPGGIVTTGPVAVGPRASTPSPGRADPATGRCREPITGRQATRRSVTDLPRARAPRRPTART